MQGRYGVALEVIQSTRNEIIYANFIHQFRRTQSMPNTREGVSKAPTNKTSTSSFAADITRGMLHMAQATLGLLFMLTVM